MADDFARNLIAMAVGVLFAVAYAWYSRTRNRLVPLPMDDEDTVRVLRKRMPRGALGKQGLVQMSYVLSYPRENDARAAAAGDIRRLTEYAKRSNGEYCSWGAPDLHG